MENRISIVIPIYKIREDFLRECVASISNQTSPNWEAILVDDGSPDLCGEICDEIAEKDSRFIAVHQSNQGVSVARNTGMMHSTGNWIAFVDPDDWVEPGWIEKLYAVLEKQTNDIILYDYWREFKEESKLEFFWTETRECDGVFLEELKNGPFFKLIQREKTNPYATPAVWNKLYKKSFLEENGLQFIPEARKAQDRLFNARALQCTDNIYYLHQPFYHYRCFGESVTNRYNANIVQLTNIQLQELSQVIEQFHLSEKAKEYLRARTCTRIYSCLRLYIFHMENEMSEKEKLNELSKLIRCEPFNSSLRKVNYNLLGKSERVFVICLRLGLLRPVKWMVDLKSGKFGNKLQA